MMSVIEAIENSAFPVWVRESPSIFAYTTILTLHAVGLATVVGLNLVLALRLLGVAKPIPLSGLQGLIKPMYAGFWINFASGASLMMASLTNVMTSFYFWCKLGFVLLAMINLEYTRRSLLKHPDIAQGRLPPNSVRTAVLALLFWAGAIVCGRVVAYPGILGNIIGV
jgi:hypothetical protein